MRVVISRIAMDSGQRLRVYPPSNTDYSFIWRAALSVRWDKGDSSLYVLPVDGFSAVDDLGQIVGAVRSEYGEELVVDDSTAVCLPEDLASEIRKLAG